ncbi:hypothetical protein CHLNCDRAFT_143503 [Chlorella variabilis]|uniref:Uncharacterized protein n=1 Tax=Chlorella variabilis TaxID=554065 RepID=E1ZB23_CHLVA|nr:hypothetical protein CHLNCDRAFT_143503 [Chlorella variabilis]EFN56950.1 hypothetical protein CHLNCDRAFT_143503 [Chlorella variabilis]|eukprot:XP_005849052.1 hypothetical protein CHLNCDRAFT_143503 [Chlorella variabilis]
MVEWSLDVAALPERPPTHIQESYSSLFLLDDGGNDTSFRLHPNGLCLVGLAPGHAAHCEHAGGSGGDQPGAAGQGAPTGHDVMLLDSAADGVQGARAQQAQPGEDGSQQQQGILPPSAQQQSGGDARLALAPKLLQAELSVGGAEYVLRCGVRGLLVELNARLQRLAGRELLRALEDGYLAILELRAAEAQQLAGRCLSEERYRQRLAEKGQGQEAAQQARPPQQQQQQQAAVQATPAPEAS